MVTHYLNFANDKATDPLYVRSQASVGGEPLPVSVEFGNMFMQHVAKHQRGGGVLRPLHAVESTHHSGVLVCARTFVGQVGSRRRRKLRMRMRSLRHPLRKVERCALLLSRHCSCEHTNGRCWWVGGCVAGLGIAVRHGKHEAVCKTMEAYPPHRGCWHTRYARGPDHGHFESGC